MPKIGDKGTLLDYQDNYEEKKSSQDEGLENYPYHNEPGTQDMDLQQAWADYYAAGGTPEAAAAYYASQGITTANNFNAEDRVDNYEQTQYGYSQEVYEQSERITSGTDNSIYALPDSGKQAQNNLDAILNESVPEPMKSSNEASGLVTYDSD